MSRYPKKILISGQTHGNEWTGRYVVKYLESLDLKQKFPNIDIMTVLSNPKAFELRRRYVDQDLNRSFGCKKNPSECYETKRAMDIKKTFEDFAAGQDVFILDLHSTTANMGSSLVLHNLAEENISVFSYLRAKVMNTRAYAWVEPKPLNFLNSLSKYGFAVEVGPVAPNTLKGSVYNQTIETVFRSLEFLNDPSTLDKQINKSEDVYVFEKNIDFPRDPDGNITAMISADFQDKNFCLLDGDEKVFQSFSGSSIKLKQTAGFYPVFINEAAYYEKSIAFTLTKKRSINTLPLSSEHH